MAASVQTAADRWEHRADIHKAFVKLTCCLVCFYGFGVVDAMSAVIRL